MEATPMKARAATVVRANKVRARSTVRGRGAMLGPNGPAHLWIPPSTSNSDEQQPHRLRGRRQHPRLRLHAGALKCPRARATGMLTLTPKTYVEPQAAK